MLFDDRVPEHYYMRLVRLLGREEAERFLEKINYDIKVIILQISFLEILQFAAQKPLFAALIISPIAIMIIYFIWDLIVESFFFN
jgi:hypothetical protein